VPNCVPAVFYHVLVPRPTLEISAGNRQMYEIEKNWKKSETPPVPRQTNELIF